MVALLSEMPGDKDRNKETCSGNPAWARQRYLYLFQNKSVDGARENNKDRKKDQLPDYKRQAREKGHSNSRSGCICGIDRP